MSTLVVRITQFKKVVGVSSVTWYMGWFPLMIKLKIVGSQQTGKVLYIYIKIYMCVYV